MNIGEPWPDGTAAWARVLAMQTKLHRWAAADPDRRFDDVHNLVYDPAFLVAAWSRVRGDLPRVSRTVVSAVSMPLTCDRCTRYVLRLGFGSPVLSGASLNYSVHQ